MDRISRIISLIANSNAPITIDTIAERFNVSNKTIRNDIKDVEKYIESRGLKLSRKPGVGIEITGPEQKKLELLNDADMDLNIKVIEPYSPEDRKNYILKRLFMAGQIVTIKDIAKELYMSEVTIRKDLDDIEEWLENYNLKLVKKKNYGLEIVGSEEDWRNAAACLITLGKETDELKEMLSNGYVGKLDYKTISKLRELIDIDYRKLEEIVLRAESMMKFQFSDEAFTSLVIHIAISIRRLEDGKDICLSDEILKGLKDKSEYAIASQVARDVEESFKVKLPEQEIGYILLHLLGAKMQQGQVEETNLNFNGEEDSDLAVIMSKDIINIAGKALSMDLSGDKQLLNGLILHLRPTLNRLEYGLNLRNPIIDQIKQNYPDIFGVAWMTSIVFEKYLNKPVNEAEVGYIALHLCAAVERQKKPLKALLVCSSGIGTSQLLAARIKRVFREIEIKGITSTISLNKERLKDIDVVISTVSVIIEKPTLIISPLLTQKDIKKIESFISTVVDKTYKDEADEIINEDFIQINADYKDRDELLKYISSRLFIKGYVKEEYVLDLIRRENVAPTEAGNGIALPHGMPKYAYKSVVCVSVLKEPIKWADEKVDVVFTICIAENEVNKYINVLKKLYAKIDYPEFSQSIRNSKNKQEIKIIMYEALDSSK